MIKARQLVPGIQDYPDLERQLEVQIAKTHADGKCRKGCGLGRLAEDFRRRVARRLKRDKPFLRP